MNLTQASSSTILTLKDIKEKESIFEKNNYLGDINNKDKNSYCYVKGFLPVLISAPHSIKQPRRPGINSAYKSQDKYTGTIARELAERTNAHIIYKTAYTGIDDNFPIDSVGNIISTEYREKIKNIIDNNQINLLIDLHGFVSNKNRDFGIELGTNYHKNLLGNEKILKIVIQEFEKKGFKLNIDNPDIPSNKKVVIDKEFPAKVKNRTISNYTATTLKTPAIQIEISSDNRMNIDNLNTIISTLENIINSIIKI